MSQIILWVLSELAGQKQYVVAILCINIHNFQETIERWMGCGSHLVWFKPSMPCLQLIPPVRGHGPNFIKSIILQPNSPRNLFSSQGFEPAICFWYLLVTIVFGVYLLWLMIGHLCYLFVLNTLCCWSFLGFGPTTTQCHPKFIQLSSMISSWCYEPFGWSAFTCPVSVTMGTQVFLISSPEVLAPLVVAAHPSYYARLGRWAFVGFSTLEAVSD